MRVTIFSYWREILPCFDFYAPTLFSLDISNDFSVTTAPAFIKNELIDLAERIWLEGLHRPVTNSESGGKHKLIKAVLILPILCWPHSALARDGWWLRCLPLAVETDRYRTPKVPTRGKGM